MSKYFYDISRCFVIHANRAESLIVHAKEVFISSNYVSYLQYVLHQDASLTTLIPTGYPYFSKGAPERVNDVQEIAFF